jgi:hypothetical protein
MFPLLVINWFMIVPETEAQISGPLKLIGKQFYEHDGTPFFPVAINYHANIVHDGLSTLNFKTVRSTAYGSDGCPSFEGGYTWVDCESSVEHDFKKIKQMGFNTIRLIMPPVRKNGSYGFEYQVKYFSDICNANTNYTIDFMPGNYSTPEVLAFFDVLGDIIDLAEDNDLYVIYLCSDHSSKDFDDRFTSLGDALDYAEYLEELSFHLKDKPALFAYDLYNEPTWVFWKHNIAMSKKSDVCTYVNIWYDSIRQHDSTHLITLGCADQTDAIYYDGTVMKIDFLSMHLYSGTRAFENFNQTTFTNRVLDMIYWCSNALQRPWILGETGFASAPDACINNNGEATQGTYAQQADFAAAVMTAIRDCGGSGFSWWCFQDLHYYCIPGSLCSSVTNEYICQSGADTDIKDIKENYFGLLEYGDPDLISGNPTVGFYSASIEKPAANVIRLFNFNNHTACNLPTSQFYNPYNHPPHANQLTGVIVDDHSGAPIEFAVVNALTIVGFDYFKNEYISHWHHTFTNGNGDFTIIPFDFLPGELPDDNIINGIEIGATGAEGIVSNSPNSLGSVIALRRDFFPYDEVITNTVVLNGENERFRGYQSLTANGQVEFRGGSTVEMRARSSVELNDDFDAFEGSWVDIYTDKMFPECVEFSGFRELAVASAAGNQSEFSNHEIELKFAAPKSVFDVEVYPNPGTGFFQLQVTQGSFEGIRTHIYNAEGELIHVHSDSAAEFEINTNRFSPGVYTLKIFNSSNEVRIKKIVKL